MQVQNSNDSNSHTLPLARIKKIMKSDEEVRRVQEYITLDRIALPIIRVGWPAWRNRRGGEGRGGACIRCMQAAAPLSPSHSLSHSLNSHLSIALT